MRFVSTISIVFLLAAVARADINVGSDGSDGAFNPVRYLYSARIAECCQIRFNGSRGFSIARINEHPAF